jgi:YnbE-like lipoprotein
MQRQRQRSAALTGWVAGVLLILAAGCTPRVEVAAPDKPITINLNVKIDHEIRVKVDKELDQVLSNNSGLF